MWLFDKIKALKKSKEIQSEQIPSVQQIKEEDKKLSELEKTLPDKVSAGPITEKKESIPLPNSGSTLDSQLENKTAESKTIDSKIEETKSAASKPKKSAAKKKTTKKKTVKKVIPKKKAAKIKSKKKK